MGSLVDRVVTRYVAARHVRRRGAWDRLPKGWTRGSLKKFWSKLTGDRKHKVTACIRKMEGSIDDPGAFCASIADELEPGWRSK